MTEPLILYDRSRSTTDWACPRKRFLNYHAEGTGIVPDTEALELAMGSIIHEGLASIANWTKEYERDASTGSVDIDYLAYKAFRAMYENLTKGTPDIAADVDYYAKEQASLVEGLLRGFYRYQWPILLKQYPKILAVEQEMSYSYEGIIFMCKPDLVVATPEGDVCYIEFKSTSNKREEWINSWPTAIQLHATSRAIEEALGEKIGHVIVQGLYKGYVSYGKLSSPLVYAYKRNGSPPFSKDDIRYEYAAGFKKSPVWEMAGRIKAWVADMPESILSVQFPCTPPIFINDALVDSFFEQRLYREQEIALAVKMMETCDDAGRKGILDMAFPQRFDQCHSAWGRPCEYQRICHSSVPEPLQNGFRRRVSHHAIELETHKDYE